MPSLVKAWVPCLELHTWGVMIQGSHPITLQIGPRISVSRPCYLLLSKFEFEAILGYMQPLQTKIKTKKRKKKKNDI